MPCPLQGQRHRAPQQGHGGRIEHNAVPAQHILHQRIAKTGRPAVIRRDPPHLQPGIGQQGPAGIDRRLAGAGGNPVQPAQGMGQFMRQPDIILIGKGDHGPGRQGGVGQQGQEIGRNPLPRPGDNPHIPPRMGQGKPGQNLARRIL